MLAVPVGPAKAIASLRRDADEVVCLHPESALVPSRVRVTVTSVTSIRAMRLRYRAAVAGSFQIAGRSVDQLVDPGILGVG